MPSKNARPELTPEYVAHLLVNGYTDEVRRFTQGIQANRRFVLELEKVFDGLIFDGAIDWEGTPSQETCFERAEECLDEMHGFLAGMAKPYTSYLVAVNHGRELSVEIGWRDPVAGEVVWDRWTIEVDDPVMAFAGIGFLFDSRDYRCEPKPVEEAEPALYRYHPERYKAYRDSANAVGKFYRQRVDPVTGSLTLDQWNHLIRPMVDEMNRKAMTFPRKLKDEYPSPSLVMDAERSLVTAYGRFVQAGRQIMDFPPKLRELLSQTNVDDIPLNTIKLPYASQYLYFGPQQDLQLEPGWRVDGAYVESGGRSGDIQFTVTAVPDDHGLSRLWYLVPEPAYAQDFTGDFRFMDLATATDSVLSDTLAELHDVESRTGGDITEDLRKEFDREAEPFPEDLRIVDVSPDLATKRLDTTSRRHPVYQAALRLVVNALCYVAAYPDDIDTVWPEGTPATLKHKVLHGKGKERQRAKSKLTALGYVPVHICGQHLAEQIASHVDPRTGLRHVATHWRRGHWRRQAHGPGRSLRKLIWVMPVLVGSRDADDTENGHLYLVS